LFRLIFTGADDATAASTTFGNFILIQAASIPPYDPPNVITAHLGQFISLEFIINKLSDSSLKIKRNQQEFILSSNTQDFVFKMRFLYHQRAKFYQSNDVQGKAIKR
jgi:hypothetical protein